MSAQRPKDSQKKHNKPPGGGRKRESKAGEDERFAGKARDARFAPIQRKNMKVKVDSRFKDMFTDKRFTLPHTVDKYGRPAKQSTSDDMRRFYRLAKKEEEEKEEEEQQVDAANGNDEPKASVYAQVEDADARDGEVVEGDDSSEGSSDESSSELSEEEEEVIEDVEDVPVGGESRRLAALKMDWEHLRAVDLLVLFNSFLPSSGSITSVAVYPSLLGLQCMAKEATEGPPREIWKGNAPKDGRRTLDMDATETFAKTQLRRYELNKLKYYFAVIECDSVETASALYSACDGLELERSSNVIDLRFIPDEETFSQKPRDRVTEVPSEYKAPVFYTKALQHTSVDLTWDGDDATRQVLKASQWGRGAEADENELQAYLASSSDEYEEPDSHVRKQKTEATIAKYKALLEEVTPKPKEEENMEITFMPGLSEKAEELVQKKLQETEHKDETVWEKHLRERKAKKAERKKMAALQLEKDEDDGEAFFDVSSKKEKGRKGKRKEKPKRLTPEEEKEKQLQLAELELLMMDGKSKKPKSDDADADHDDSRKKQKKKGLKEADSSFKVNLQDERFKALIDSDAFAIDKTNPNYRETVNMQAIMAAKRKKALEREMHEEKKARARLEDARSGAAGAEEGTKKKTNDPALAALVASVKRKSVADGAKKQHGQEH